MPLSEYYNVDCGEERKCIILFFSMFLCSPKNFILLKVYYYSIIFLPSTNELKQIKKNKKNAKTKIPTK